MEVVGIVSSSSAILDLFGKFIYSYEPLIFMSKDPDTAFFGLKNGNEFHEVYFHFYYDDVAHEFEYNHSENEVSFIKDYFKGGDLFIFDIQIRNYVRFQKLIKDFKDFLYLEDPNLPKQVLICDPFKDIYPLHLVEEIHMLDYRSLTSFYNELVNMYGPRFKETIPNCKFLTPDNIIGFIESNHISKFQSEPIPNWELFENCEIDWSNDDITEILFKHINDEVFSLITDEGLRENKIFVVERHTLASFMDNYENYYKMEFFQASDYIVFGNYSQRFTILSHNGILSTQIK